MSNTDSLVMTNMIIQNCTTSYHLLYTALLINNCSFLHLSSIYIYHAHNGTSLLGVNVVGTSILKHLRFCAVKLLYEESNVATKQNIITVESCSITENSAHSYSIIVDLNQASYKVRFVLSSVMAGDTQKGKLLLVASQLVDLNEAKLLLIVCLPKGWTI